MIKNRSAQTCWSANRQKQMVISLPQLLSQDIEVPGSLAASKETELHPEAAGRVTGVYFKERRLCFAGATLLKYMMATCRRSRTNYRCRLKTAQQTVDRYAALFEIMVWASRIWFKCWRWTISWRDMNIIRTIIAKTNPAAPFSGKIGITTINTGCICSPKALLPHWNQPAETIYGTGTYAALKWKGCTGEFYGGRAVQNLSATISATEKYYCCENRNLRVMALVTKQDAALLAGFAKSKIPLGENNAAPDGAHPGHYTQGKK